MIHFISSFLLSVVKWPDQSQFYLKSCIRISWNISAYDESNLILLKMEKKGRAYIKYLNMIHDSWFTSQSTKDKLKSYVLCYTDLF